MEVWLDRINSFEYSWNMSLDFLILSSTFIVGLFDSQIMVEPIDKMSFVYSSLAPNNCCLRSNL